MIYVTANGSQQYLPESIEIELVEALAEAQLALRAIRHIGGPAAKRGRRHLIGIITRLERAMAAGDDY